jgi:hypothetical protein
MSALPQIAMFKLSAQRSAAAHLPSCDRTRPFAPEGQLLGLFVGHEGDVNGLLQRSGDVTVNEGGEAIVSHVSRVGRDSKKALIIHTFEALPKGDIEQQSV